MNADSREDSTRSGLVGGVDGRGERGGDALSAYLYKTDYPRFVDHHGDRAYGHAIISMYSFSVGEECIFKVVGVKECADPGCVIETERQKDDVLSSILLLQFI